MITCWSVLWTLLTDPPVWGKRPDPKKQRGAVHRTRAFKAARAAKAAMHF